MRLASRIAAIAALGAAAPGCFFGTKEHDIDRTPMMDAGVGAAVILPGQSVPMYPPAAAPGTATQSSQSGAPGSESGSSTQGGVPGQGMPISMIGGTKVDEERHLSVKEEPIWWKYVVLPFAVAAAPFKYAADKVRGEPEPGPAVPQNEPARPKPVAPPKSVDYETARMQQLERELDRRGAPDATPAVTAPPRTAALAAGPSPSLADELVALQRVPSAGRPAAASTSATAPAPTSPAPAPAAAADGVVDRNGDGRVDEWLYREGGEIVRRVLDEDFDGRAERTLVFDRATRAVARVEEDLDQNGTVDAWTDYEDGRVLRRRADSNADGSVDTWTFYRDGQIVRHEQDSTGNGFRDRVGYYRDGRLERDEVDSNADGRADVTNHYDEREQVLRREEDTDFDGTVDRVSHFEGGRLARREILAPTGTN
jgi:hypothetical protein